MTIIQRRYQPKPAFLAVFLGFIVMLLCIGCFAASALAGILKIAPIPIAIVGCVLSLIVGWQTAKQLD